jgi:hypothetical protein
MKNSIYSLETRTTLQLGTASKIQQTIRP